MCLLAEVAYEHDEDLREHVPLLLQALLIVQDSPEPIVYQHAQQVGSHSTSPYQRPVPGSIQHNAPFANVCITHELGGVVLSCLKKIPCRS